MSGYFNRPPARTGRPTGPPRDPDDYFDAPLTGPPTRHAPNDYNRQTPSLNSKLLATQRSSNVSNEPANAPIVSADSVTGQSLTLVISIMCFLACLTVGAVYLINRSAAAWTANIASEITVQVETTDRQKSDQHLARVTAFLRDQQGISTVTPFSLERSAALLEPWLGSTDLLKALPVPRLIAVQLDRSAPADLTSLSKKLQQRFPGTKLDDHRSWRRQIQGVTRSFALGGFAILLLVGAATTAIIVSATRSAMASNREIVEVLHFVGATDRFIAREFERHFLTLGIRAGLVGALSSMTVFFVMPTIMHLLGGGSVASAEMRRLVGSGLLDLQGYIWLGVVVSIIAGLCMFTSRLGVYRILHAQQ